MANHLRSNTLSSSIPEKGPCERCLFPRIFVTDLHLYVNPLYEKCAEWKEAEDIDYSVYGTPIESTTYKFAKCLQKRFGKKKGITDKNYITNSYHVPVFEEIDAFSKLKLESEFQRLSPGGAISYVETPNLQNNLEVVLQIMKFIYDNIMYAELNTKSAISIFLILLYLIFIPPYS